MIDLIKITLAVKVYFLFNLCVCAVWYLAYSADTHKCPLSNLKLSVGGVQFCGWCPVDTVSRVGGDTVGLVACKPVSENHTSAPRPIKLCLSQSRWVTLALCGAG